MEKRAEDLEARMRDMQVCDNLDSVDVDRGLLTVTEGHFGEHIFPSVVEQLQHAGLTGSLDKLWQSNSRIISHPALSGKVS